MFVQAQKLPGASRTFRKSLHPANKYVIVITFTKKDITSYLMSVRSNYFYLWTKPG